MKSRPRGIRYQEAPSDSDPVFRERQYPRQLHTSGFDYTQACHIMQPPFSYTYLNGHTARYMYLTRGIAYPLSICDKFIGVTDWTR